jgi:hypothetical protein
MAQPITETLKGFFSLHHLTPFIIAAFGTGLMRRLRFQAIGADTWRYRLKKIMRAAFPAA